jgi:hypothetical protein
MVDRRRPYRGSVSVTDGFVEAMVASPLGVALLAVLESRTRRPAEWVPSLETSPASVSAAANAVERMSFGEFVEVAVRTGAFHVGPWISEAAETAAAAYRDATARLPIAEAVNARFGTALHAPIDRAAQQWWSDEFPAAWLDRLSPLFHDYEHVYGAGQFTWAGLWTVTDPPPEVHQELVGAWELERGPVSRWRLPADAGARVFEVHRPTDWARLVTDHLREGLPHPEWELPGINQHPSDLSTLLSVPGQRAVRTSIRRHLVPDWRAVVERYDGVHLSWAGFISTEGCITDLGDGDVTLLRYWFSERTHWLADVFGEPQPATDPMLHDHVTDKPSSVSDASSPANRQRSAGHSLHRLLGR